MLKLIKLFSYNMKNDSSNFSEKLFTPIIELIKIKKYDEALNKLEEFPNQDSDIINRFRGSIYLNKKDWKKSLSYYEKLSDDSKNYKILNNIGVSLYKLGKFSGAINEFNRSININKKFLSAYENLSITHKQLGNYDLSIKFSLQTLDLAPNNKKITDNLIEIFNYYQPKNYENPILNLNHQISILDKIKNNKLIKINLINNILEKSERIFLEKNISFNYAETQIYRRNKINLNCDRHFGIFNKYKIIPKFCFSCYKLQINIRNVLDLTKLYFYFNNLNLKKNNIRKCMIELREKVAGNYKGYLYANSIDEAQNLKEIIENDLKNYKINFEKIEIKHGCTEYYEQYELYKNIQEDVTDKIYQKEWDKIEKDFDEKNLIIENNKEKIYDSTLNKFNLSDFLIIKNWFIYAHIINDYSYKDIFRFDIKTDHIAKMDIEKIKMRKNKDN